MTTLATGSSVTVNVGDAGSITIATNGGMASIAITPTVGAAYSEGIGPLPSRKTWKLAEGGSATISNQTASLDYDWERGGGIDPALSALVSGARNLAPQNYNPRMRFGNAVSSGANSTARTNQQAWVLPFDIYGFQIGWESIETADTTISLTKWGICGTAGGTLTATLDDVANFHTIHAATPRSLTYGGSASGVIPQRLAADVPGAVLWSDVAYAKVSAGQALTVRALQSSLTAYPLSPNGIPRADTLALNPAFAAAAWTDATDRVTTVTSWGVTSANFQANLPIAYLNVLTDAPSKSVAVIGDSITTGFTNSGSQSYPPLQRAAELLGTTLGFRIVPYQRGWSGKEATAFYTYALSTIAATYPPDALIYQVWSQNDTAATSNDAELALAMDVVSRCRRAGIQPILMTGIPLNGDTLADDNERKRLNAVIRTWGVPLIDADAVISDGASPAAYKAAYGAAVHPNYDGYTALTTEYARVLALALA